MISRKQGVVVNMASIIGHLVMTPNAVYCAAKHAMVAWSEALRHELARFGITVCVICPGRVETPFFTHPSFQTRAPRREAGWFNITTKDVADATLRAIANRQFMTYVPKYLGMAAWLTHTLPFLLKPYYGKIMQERIASIYAKEGNT